MRKLMLSLAIVTSAGMAFSETISRSIATVNGEAIFSAEFDRAWETLLEQRKQLAPDEAISVEWKASQKKALLDQLIEEKLLTQEAKSRNIKVQKRQLEEGLLQVKNRFKIRNPAVKPTKEEFERPLTAKENDEFQKELKIQNLSEKEFTDKIEGQLKVMNLTEDEVKRRIPSPVKEGGSDGKEPELTSEYEKEAKELYAQIEKKFNQKDFKASPDDEVDQMVDLLQSRLGETVRARHILVKSNRTDDMKNRTAALDKIKGIKKQLENGADFEELARQKSDGPGAANGGDLGFFTRGQMVPEFEKAAFTLPVGGISDVIETQFGYHVLKVEEKKAPQKLRFDEIKLDLANYLYQKRGQKRYEEFIAELRKKAEIKILTDLENGKNG